MIQKLHSADFQCNSYKAISLNGLYPIVAVIVSRYKNFSFVFSDYDFCPADGPMATIGLMSIVSGISFGQRVMLGLVDANYST